MAENHAATIGGADDRLRRLVAPPGWTNPEPRARYDLVVVGAGTAGLVAAAGAAGLGARVALVERHRMGGDCLNTGCVPSKAILRSARAIADARGAAELGVAGTQSVDFAAVMEDMREIRAGMAVHDSAERFRELGVDVFLGDARFAGKDRVHVARESAAVGHELRFRRAIVATGSRPAVPPIPGLAEIRYRTSDTVWDLRELPPRMAIVGGGAVGCELAQAFARFGSRVTLVESGPGILAEEEEDAAAAVARALERDGIETLLGSAIERVEPWAGRARLHIAGFAPLEADLVLVATGRTPNVEGLGLEAAGIAHGNDGIEVDAGLRTTNRRVWAAGDVCSRLKFTHVADAHARIAVRNALFPGRTRADSRAIPRCTYTDPELAGIGHTARSAERAGIRVRTFTQPFSAVDRAVLDRETEGFARVHVREGSDEIVGATIVGRHAGETIAEVAVAMAADMGLGGLSEVVHPYPTRAEVLRKLADDYQRTRLTPRAQRWIRRWLSLGR